MVFQKHELPLGPKFPPPPPPSPDLSPPLPPEINVKEQNTDIDEISKKFTVGLVYLSTAGFDYNAFCEMEWEMCIRNRLKKSPFTMYAVTQVPLFQAFVHSWAFSLDSFAFLSEMFHDSILNSISQICVLKCKNMLSLYQFNYSYLSLPEAEDQYLCCFTGY